MRTGWRIGRIFGIDINIDSSWIVIFVLFSWSMAGGYFPRQYPHWTRALAWAMGVLTSLLVFASVLVHELAHSLVAIRQGEKVRSITLFLLGGVAQISEEPKAPLQEFRMAAVGPADQLRPGRALLSGLPPPRAAEPAAPRLRPLSGRHQRRAGGLQPPARVPLGRREGLPVHRLEGHGRPQEGDAGRLAERPGLRLPLHLPGPVPLPQGRPGRTLVHPHRLVPSQRLDPGL